jgi:polygalacturonase
MKNVISKNCTGLKNILSIFLAAFFLFSLFSGCNLTGSAANAGWDQVPDILNQINAPSFPDRKFSITDFGAVGNGKMECTEAIKKAIHACHSSGGGQVIVPAGIYLTGAIHLKSNVNLHVTKNATILFSQNPDDFLPVVYTRFEGIECMNYSPFIYAYEQENIAITGGGTLDGQAAFNNWWIWKGRKEHGWEEGKPNGNNDMQTLHKMAEDRIAVENRIFGEGCYLRPNFIQPYRCKNILIDSITIKNSPMWVIHPVLSENVIVQNVTVISHGPNNDGCNPESSKNVLIKTCFFDTGDDCIAIKAGRNKDGRRVNVSSENIIIQKCTMKDGHGGVSIGSETSGNIRNIFVEDCLMDSPNLERALRIKTNSLRGGIVENIFFRNCTIGEVSEAIIKINFDYGEGDLGEFTPVVRNIYINNITSRKSRYAIFLTGYERSPVMNLTIQDCNFKNVEKGNILDHYKNLRLKNVYINGEYQ